MSPELGNLFFRAFLTDNRRLLSHLCLVGCGVKPGQTLGWSGKSVNCFSTNMKDAQILLLARMQNACQRIIFIGS
ncbi:MAG: hypothetical protein OMM_15252 [Candidatus Magnetoglobus multicellularis str. Araruama]|uniref:Uncharacterized protein n=1 Tax=Candidatus Magnetoglobus multicellularis str. Araruama TaxID=890399 RepID=A0A1V1NQJ8_9BACT|nr:MAG: hypothetical protein OMM_15252 [Candidatus Magnetoglobus multicellularis str. Araruama]